MTLILCGGGWAEKTVIPNKLFGSLIDSSKPILYIPLADMLTTEDTVSTESPSFISRQTLYSTSLSL